MTQPNLTDRNLGLTLGPQISAIVNEFDQAAAAERSRVASDTTIVDKTAAISQALSDVRELYAARLNLITTGLNNQLQAIQDRAQAALPKPATGVEALLTRQAWWARTHAMLQAGIPIGSIIAQATDPEQLHSLAEELPTAAQTGLIAAPAGPGRFQAAITSRLAQLAGSTAVAAQEDAADAQATMRALEPILTKAAHHIGATDYRAASAADMADALDQLGVKLRSRY